MFMFAINGCCVPYSRQGFHVNGCHKGDNTAIIDETIHVTYEKDVTVEHVDDIYTKEDTTTTNIAYFQQREQDYIIKTTEINMARTVSSISFEEGSYYDSNFKSFSQDSNFDFLDADNDDDFVLLSNEYDEDDDSSRSLSFYDDDDYFAIMRDIANLVHEQSTTKNKVLQESRYADGRISSSLYSNKLYDTRDKNVEETYNSNINNNCNKTSNNSKDHPADSTIVRIGYLSQEIDAVRNSNFKLIQSALLRDKRDKHKLVGTNKEIQKKNRIQRIKTRFMQRILRRIK